MIKVGITGSLASGKTTSSKIISYKRGPLFSADNTVKQLYLKKSFKRLVAKKLKLHSNFNLKKQVKDKILKENKTLKKLEKILHPLVRREMLNFSKKFKKNKFIFFEIPLLIESKLNRFFDLIIFIKSKKKLRLKRFKTKNGNIKLFHLLESKQLKDTKKSKLCDHIIVNNKSLIVLKKKLLNIIETYE